MEINKPILIKRNETNSVKTSSGEFLEYISWKQCKQLGVGIGIHKKRFPKQGYLQNKKVDEIIMLLSGKGSIIIKDNDKEKKYSLSQYAVMFIPKNCLFCFLPEPEMEILSATGPAWYPKQQSGLDYRRKEKGRIIL
jgi:hypothetical protein